jgi:hypothetical protein
MALVLRSLERDERSLMARKALPTRKLKIGDRVLIRLSSRLPYAGQVGIVLEINEDDVYGAILVRFSDSLQFRYTWSELLLLTSSASRPPRSSPGGGIAGARLKDQVIQALKLWLLSPNCTLDRSVCAGLLDESEDYESCPIGADGRINEYSASIFTDRCSR